MEKNQYMGAGKARARQCAPVNTWARGAVRAEPQKGEHGTSLIDLDMKMYDTKMY